MEMLDPKDEIVKLDSQKLLEVFFSTLEICRKKPDLKYKTILTLSFAELCDRDLMGLDQNQKNEMLELFEEMV